jgi:nicotinamide phosphoribosyltransferase
MNALRKTADNPETEIAFKLHDFGARGVSSGESAELGGMAHLVNFMGTDTVEGLISAVRYYDADYKATGFSIPAAEHSTITSWGKASEYDAYNNMVEQYAAPGKIFAVVSDSYDIFNAVENIWIGRGLLKKVKERGATVVIRPDSGDPTLVPVQIINLLCDKYGYTINSKGFKVLPNEVRVIQGDGITPETLEVILHNLEVCGLSASNIAFGMGGGLLQMVNRDTYKFAMKCSAAKVDGEWVDVFKEPITDNGKRSKRGRLTLVHDGKQFMTVNADTVPDSTKDMMQTVYRDGPYESSYVTFEEVRAESNKYL